ncbi:MAG TPA: DUF3429 domain-containing protein [Acetobacteraceae bacterium]|nr:DUF3429 domain-containing protein [Acetobacteraceae bacterium]
MTRKLDFVPVLLGLAGLIPLLATGLAAVSAGYDQSPAVMLALIGYGALVLSFLGGVHWGLALADGAARDTAIEHPPADTATERKRFALGVLPALVGWIAMLVALVTQPVLSLAVLIAAFIATLVAEAQAARHGLVPAHYMGLRWVLSVIVIAVLTTVLVLRLLGAHIVL